MNIHPALLVGAYILIGIFVASAIDHSDKNHDYNTDFGLYVMVIIVWPIILLLLVVVLVIAIPYILGKWAGHLLHDLLR